MHVITTAFNIVLGLISVWALHLSARDLFRLRGGAETAAPPPPGATS
jgi:hypothetical protein